MRQMAKFVNDARGLIAIGYGVTCYLSGENGRSGVGVRLVGVAMGVEIGMGISPAMFC